MAGANVFLLLVCFFKQTNNYLIGIKFCSVSLLWFTCHKPKYQWS